MTAIAMSHPPAPRFVIAGDGLAGWMAAAALARATRPADRSIRVIGCAGAGDGLTPLGGADATLPITGSDRIALDLDEDRLVAGTGGSFTVGIAVSGWSAPGATYFHPFGDVGANLGPVAFHHLLMRLRHEGVSLRLANYSLSALAAQAGRFTRPGRNTQSVLSTLEYGLHVDCRGMADTLQAAAEAAGVVHTAGNLAHVEREADGAIAAVTMNGGERIEGDLFLDCTGIAARLLDDARATEWEDWSAWLPCDRVLSAHIGTPDAPPPYSHAQAHRGGWIRHLPMQGRSRFTALYRSEHLSDDEARDSLRAAAGGELADVTPQPVTFGRRRQAWFRNCIALGSAAVLIDPIATTNLHLLRTAVDRLLQLLPADRGAQAEAREYNRLTELQLDHARDFAVLHYKLNGRRGEPLWEACRDMAVPSSLDYKIRLYRSRGRVAMYDEEPVEAASWINLFDEHGVYPRRYSPIADGFASADLKAHLGRVRAIMLDELAKMPLHGEYLSRLQMTAPPDKAKTG